MRVRRVLTLLVAYACASALAGLVLTIPLMTWMLAPVSDISWSSLAAVAWFAALYGVLVAVFAFPASLPVIVIGEYKGITSARAHVLAGTGIALAGFALLALATAAVEENPIDMVRNSPVSSAWPMFLPLSLAAGAGAGLVFWLIASRLPNRIPQLGEAPRGA